MAQVDTTPKTNNIDLEDEDEVTTSPAASEHTKAKTSSAVFDDDDVDAICLADLTFCIFKG